MASFYELDLCNQIAQKRELMTPIKAPKFGYQAIHVNPSSTMTKKGPDIGNYDNYVPFYFEDCQNTQQYFPFLGCASKNDPAKNFH